MAIIKKSAFARQIGVDPSRITQYLKEGLLDGPAIVGEGRGAMIDSDIACAQLKERLDSDQVHGENGLWTRLDGQPGDLDAVKGAIAIEKLEHARSLTRKLASEEKIRDGAFIDATAAKVATDRAVGLMKAFYYTTLGTLANSLASAIAASKAPLRRQQIYHVLEAGYRAAYTAKFGEPMYPRGIADSEWLAMTQEERKAHWDAANERDRLRLAAEAAEDAAFEELYPAMKAYRLRREAEGS